MDRVYFQKIQSGFTLIEMMVAISIVAILVSVAVPSFNEMVMSNKLRSYANSLVSSAILARSEAIKRNAVVTLCASSNGTSCTGGWNNGWIILSANNEVVQRQQALDANYNMTGGVNTLLFQPTGLGTTQVTVTVCKKLPSSGSQERVVTISATGKTSVAKTTTGSCP